MKDWGNVDFELELLACFGVEPQLREAGVPWWDNDAVYLIDIDGLSVSFAIVPGYLFDVRVIVCRGEQRLFEFNARSVADVRVIDERSIDAVEIVLSEQSWLRITLRPAFEITQGFGVPIPPR